MDKQMETRFVPIFEKDGNQFIVCHRDFVAENERGAWEIGIGASLVECIIWGARFIGDTCPLTDELRGYEAKLEGVAVALISGPLHAELDAGVGLDPLRVLHVHLREVGGAVDDEVDAVGHHATTFPPVPSPHSTRRGPPLPLFLYLITASPNRDWRGVSRPCI